MLQVTSYTVNNCHSKFLFRIPMFISFPSCYINEVPTLPQNQNITEFSRHLTMEKRNTTVYPFFGKERQGNFWRTSCSDGYSSSHSTCPYWILDSRCGHISLLHRSVHQCSSYCSPPAVCHLPSRTCYLPFGEVLSIHHKL